MSAIDRDLRIASAASLICAAVIVLVKVVAVRAAFAVPLCFVLPGYAIAAATFTRPPLRGQVLLMLVPALSLTTLVLGALALDVVPGGIRVGSWAALLVIVVLAGCGIAAVRRPRRDTHAAPPRHLAIRIRPSDVLLLVAAVVLAGGALALSRTPLRAKNAVGYTQLWMLSTGTAQAPALRIGISSAEQRPATYRLELRSGRGQPTVVEPALRLKPGARTVVDVPLTLVGARTRQIVTARLFKFGTPGVYRKVNAQVTPPSGP